MTVEKIVRLFLQLAVYTLAALLADLPTWQFIGVVILILIAEKIGKVK